MAKIDISEGKVDQPLFMDTSNNMTNRKERLRARHLAFENKTVPFMALAT